MRFSKIIYYIKLTRNLEIIRRYFITNGFDGTITIMGIVLGNLYAGIIEPFIILAAGLGGGIAMCISGISSVYLSEKAEKIKEFRQLELAMGKDLARSDIGEAIRIVPFMTALASGFSPLIASLLILLPFMAVAGAGTFTVNTYYLSVLISLLLLSSFGLLMGKVARQNIWKYALKALAVGFVTIVVIFVIGRYLLNL